MNRLRKNITIIAKIPAKITLEYQRNERKNAGRANENPIKFNYDDYDILLKNRLTKLGFGIMYKEKFEIWHFAHTVHGGIAEKPLYPSISVDEILEEAGMWETGQFKNQQVKEQ